MLQTDRQTDLSGIETRAGRITNSPPNIESYLGPKLLLIEVENVTIPEQKTKNNLVFDAHFPPGY